MALPVENRNDDTIAAIATAVTEAGIGIIRISGTDAISIGDRIFRNASGCRALAGYQANTIHFGHIIDPEQKITLDEVMVSVMKHPHSYTTEDTVEINTHGGIFLLHRILELVLREGARLAEPGEFTRRAFLGGRIDLGEAEAVMDLISSQNEFALESSASQLTGVLSGKIRSLRARVIHELAFIESALDDPENYDTEQYPQQLKKTVQELIGEMDALLFNADDHRILKEGIRTAIIGRPNAGKSSLLNYLAGEDRAIVTDIAGTTRDTLEESVRVGGVLLHLIDTAGIRQTEDVVEKIGVERARKAMNSSDLILLLFDSSSSLTEEDRFIVKEAACAVQQCSRCIVLLNKTDLTEQCSEDQNTVAAFLEDNGFSGFSGAAERGGNRNRKDEDSAAAFLEEDGFFAEEARNRNRKDKNSVTEFLEKDGFAWEAVQNSENRKGSDLFPPILPVSVKTGEGMEALPEKIRELFHAGEIQDKNEVYITAKRHAEAVRNARNSLHLVLHSIEDGMSEDFYSIDLMNCYAELGKILGEQVEDDLVEEIFSKFCLGK